MTFSATYFGSSGWFLEIGDLRILIDPWLTGNLVFPPGPWLIEGILKKEVEPPEGINLILLTQGLADHAHPPSLKILSRTIPVICSKSASKVVKNIGFSSILELSPGEKHKYVDLEIEATAGASVPTLENGYLLKHECGSLYIEPHGFLDIKIPSCKIDAVITPVVNLKLPLAGNFIQGKTVLPEILQRFQPLTILASTTGGDASFTGIINKLIKVEGDIEEASKILKDDTVLIEPIPGNRYILAYRK